MRSSHFFFPLSSRIGREEKSSSQDCAAGGSPSEIALSEVISGASAYEAEINMADQIIKPQRQDTRCICSSFQRMSPGWA